METKNCLICNKLMKREDYLGWWGSRKYCSPDCSMKGFIKIQNKYRITKTKLTWKSPHGDKLLNINSIVNGNLIGAKIIAGTYEPDIIKDGCEIELEQIPNYYYKKYLNKFKRPRFDNVKPKKRILIISIPKELNVLFDEFYLYENPNLKRDLIQSFDLK